MFRFQTQVALFLLFLIPVLGLIMWMAGHRTRRDLLRFAESALARQLSESVRWGARRAKAVLLLDESLAIATELGMPPLMERVQVRLETVLRV